MLKKSTFLEGGAMVHFKIDLFGGRSYREFQNLPFGGRSYREFQNLHFWRAELSCISKSTFLEGGALGNFKIDFFTVRNGCLLQNLCTNLLTFCDPREEMEGPKR